jgi:hypothetical protein
MDLWLASVAFGVASYVAIFFNCLARDELNLADGQIRRFAVSGALLIATALAASCFRWGDGKIR